MIPRILRLLSSGFLALGALLLLGELVGLWGYASYVGLALAAAGGAALLLLSISPRLVLPLTILSLAVGTWVVLIDPLFGHRQTHEVQAAVLVLGDERLHRSSVVRVLPNGPSWQVSIDPQTPCAIAALDPPIAKVVVSETKRWGRRISYGPTALIDATGRQFHCIRGTGVME